MQELEFWGYQAVFFFLWLANMGNAPGGGIVIPISMIFFKLDAKNAIALSNLSIFISSFVRFFWMVRKPHPLKNGGGTVIDYNLTLIMLPMITSGAQLGVMLNIILPDMVVMIFFILLMGGGRGLTCYHALRIYAKERAEKAAKLAKVGVGSGSG